jgi:hypothetical protein
LWWEARGGADGAAETRAQSEDGEQMTNDRYPLRPAIRSRAPGVVTGGVGGERAEPGTLLRRIDVRDAVAPDTADTLQRFFLTGRRLARAHAMTALATKSRPTEAPPP